mgnify:CR=1 FL=1
MNPAALKVHLRDLKPGGLLIVNTAAFDKRNLDKAGYAAESAGRSARWPSATVCTRST